MAGSIRFEMEDGGPVPEHLFPDVDLSAPPVDVTRTIYVSNVGDADLVNVQLFAKDSAIQVKGALSKSKFGPDARDLGNIAPGARVAVQIRRDGEAAGLARSADLHVKAVTAAE